MKIHIPRSTSAFTFQTAIGVATPAEDPADAKHLAQRSGERNATAKKKENRDFEIGDVRAGD